MPSRCQRASVDRSMDSALAASPVVRSRSRATRAADHASPATIQSCNPLHAFHSNTSFATFVRMAATREPRIGEKCAACGQPAQIVYIKKLGDVPTCQLPKPIEPPPLRPRLT